jgi:hypothetical protein
MRNTAWVVLLSSLAAVPADASEGFAWKWTPGQTRRFVAKAEVVLPEAIEFNAAVNIDALVNTVQLDLVLTCAALDDVGKTAWLIRCDIDAASVRATPNPQSIHRVEKVAPEWAAVLADQAWIEIVQGVDGKLRQVDLKGVDTRINRLRRIGEMMRQLVLRAIAPLDVHLPKGGDDRGAGQWIQKGGLAWMLPSLTGTLGSSETRWQIGTRAGDRVLLASSAKGLIASSEEFNGQPRNTIAAQMTGAAVWDAVDGAIVESSYKMTGTVTASSVQAEAREYSYSQVALVRQLASDAPDPQLEASGENAIR